MKYKIGDLLLINRFRFKARFNNRLQPRTIPRGNTYLEGKIGLITCAERYDINFKPPSSEEDNGYVFFSNLDGKEYYLYEDELDAEVVGSRT